MDLTLRPRSRISGLITAPPSKSDAHRALICACLTGGAVRGAGDSEDIRATLGVLRSFGAEWHSSGDTLRFSPLKGVGEEASTDNKFPEADCGESGSTLRFLLPVCGALGLKRTFTGRGRLPERPIGPILDEMFRHGVTFSAKSLPLTLSGRLEAGEYVLPGNISSQFISGFLLALSITGGSVRVTGKLESAAYVDMTVATIAAFGVKWKWQDVPEGRIYTREGGALKAPEEPYPVDGDWSGAAFPLVAGALGGEVTVRGLRRDSLQGDRAVADLLGQMGAEVSWKDGAVTVRRAGPLKPLKADISGIPDLFPALAVAACGAVGDSFFENTERLRIKESDRIESTSAMLRALGGEISVEGGTVRVRGTGSLAGGTVDPRGDHRIAMSAAAASVLCGAPVTVKDPECSAKSYPAFFSDLARIGGVTV